MTARCKSCNAPIEWRKTQAGKRIPVNENPIITIRTDKPEPDTCIVTPTGRVAWGARITTNEPVPEGQMVTGKVSHFATCPDAAKFRGGRG
jgi:hypothetical protein